MPRIKIRRGCEILPDNNIRFGIRITNISDLAVSDVEVILDYTESLFKLEGERVQKVGVIPPAGERTAEFILKPLGCVHKVNIEALISYRDAKWGRYRVDMRPKEVHCVCPFLKGKKMARAEFLELSVGGHSAETGLNFRGVPVEQLTSFLLQTCRIRHFKVDDFSIDGGRMLYLASESIGEKAYYLLTVLIREEGELTQVMLRAVSDKPYGLNGFLSETMADLRHVVSAVQSAQEIGIIKKEQVINIIDSVVQRTSFGGGEGGASVNIQDSVVQRTEFNAGEDRRVKEEAEGKKREELRLRREQEQKAREALAEKERQDELRKKQDDEILRRQEAQRAEQVKKVQAERERIERERRAGEGRDRVVQAAARLEQDKQTARKEQEPIVKKKSKTRTNIFMLVILLGALLVGFVMFAPGYVPEKSTPYPYPFPSPNSNQNTYTNSIGMDFVLIPAGEFDMGSPSGEEGRSNSEEPVHKVKIPDSFYLGKYEVTQKQWREVMGQDPSSSKGDDLPVERVSWDDVQVFIKKLNTKEGGNKYHLPSEAEWEYAARAGTTTRYSFGDDESKLGDYAWFAARSSSQTHPVGQKKPNPWGLYDMYGNVWEWVQDLYHFGYIGAPTDGSSWESGGGSERVARGGSLGSQALYCRSAGRYSFAPPFDRNVALGFRLLMAP